MLCGNNKAFDKTADVQTGLRCCWLTLLHSEKPKLYTVLAFLSAIMLSTVLVCRDSNFKIRVDSLKINQVNFSENFLE